ncbi:MAG TPA: hypothetical protein VMO26_13560 [Vicinamibacterales bacterium]|nr:hypothetical protein [Vicinamibacterales bacterium]
MPWRTLALVVLPCALAAHALTQPSNILPEVAVNSLAASLEAARGSRDRARRSAQVGVRHSGEQAHD